MPKAKNKSKGIQKSAFAKIPELKDGISRADGMAVDRDGRVYVATDAGVQVFDRKGKFSATLKYHARPPISRFLARTSTRSTSPRARAYIS